MSAVYFLIPTAYGQQRIAAAHDQQVIALQDLVLGDANGVPYSPIANQARTTLVNQRAAVPVQSVTIAGTIATVLTTIESDVGGFNIHEIGLTDETGQLVYIGNYTGAYRPVLAEGGGGETALYMHIKADAGSSVLIEVSPNNVTANRQWVIDNFVSIPVFNAHVAQNTLEHTNLLALIEALTELLANTNQELEMTQWTVIQEQIDLIKERIQALEDITITADKAYPVGVIIDFGNVDFNPNSYAPFAGTNWVRHGEGKASVGYSTQADDPAWTKTVGGTFGEFGHVMTTEEMKEHKHSEGLYNKFVGMADEAYAANSFVIPAGLSDGLTTEGVDNDYSEYELQVAGIGSAQKVAMTEKAVGGNQPFNIVQPSIVDARWRRTA